MNALRLFPYLVVTLAVTGFPLAAEAALVAPDALNPGATVSPVPNGDSSSPTNPGVALFDDTEPFDFNDGLLAGTLRERVLQYQNVVSSFHPFGSGLYIDFEISLTSGDVTEFTVPGYSGVGVTVKQCGISNCGGSGANGVLTTSASRSLDGDDISFLFAGDLSGTAHSANLQLLTNATSFVDPFATFEDSNGDLFSIPVLTVSVPEPSTWAMAIVGFLGLSFIACCGKRSATPAI
jgi:hypothetical protein